MSAYHGELTKDQQQKMLDDQVKAWRKEVARLNELIVFATTTPSACDCDTVAQQHGNPGEAFGGWISVSDQLPNKYINLLLTISTGKVMTGYYAGNRSWEWPDTDDDEDLEAHVTHYMHLPVAATSNKNIS